MTVRDRLSRAGMPGRDRGRRAKGTEDRRAAVAEVRFVDAGRPEGRRTKARHRRVAGWRPDEGREGVRFPSIQACFTLSTVANKPEDQQNDQRGFNNP